MKVDSATRAVETRRDGLIRGGVGREGDVVEREMWYSSRREESKRIEASWVRWWWQRWWWLHTRPMCVCSATYYGWPLQRYTSDVSQELCEILSTTSDLVESRSIADNCYISDTIYTYFGIQITMSNLSIYEENTYRYSKNVNTLSMIKIRLMFVQLIKADDFT